MLRIQNLYPVIHIVFCGICLPAAVAMGDGPTVRDGLFKAEIDASYLSLVETSPQVSTQQSSTSMKSA